MRSLQRHLLVWILSALSVGGLVLTGVSYFVMLDELGEVFDENLKQVALATGRHHGFGDDDSPVQLPRLPNFYEQEGDFDYLTMVWTREGALKYISDPSVSLPFVNKTGMVHLNGQDDGWHIYSIDTDEGIVQAAQRASSRATLAAEVASKAFVPTLLLIGMIGVLLVVALRRGLRPLDRATQDVAKRSEASLEPIRDDDLPQELLPLIRALNALLARLGHAFARERKFVADAAHGLRTPVTALSLQVQLVERAPTAEARTRAIAELKAGVERSHHLLEQLLELSRLDPAATHLKRERVSLAELARSVVAQLSIKAGRKGIDLGADIVADVWVDGDMYQLAVLLNNLVDNAIRYTQPGGVVDVIVSNDGGTPTLAVRDNGPGIAEEDRERAFDRFYRGQDAQDTIDGEVGSGLGLAIVKTIAERHGATVRLSASPGGGLTVTLSFPTAP